MTALTNYININYGYETFSVKKFSIYMEIPSREVFESEQSFFLSTELHVSYIISNILDTIRDYKNMPLKFSSTFWQNFIREAQQKLYIHYGVD